MIFPAQKKMTTIRSLWIREKLVPGSAAVVEAIMQARRKSAKGTARDRLTFFQAPSLKVLITQSTTPVNPNICVNEMEKMEKTRKNIKQVK